MSSYCKVWINNQEIEADPERKLMGCCGTICG